MKRQPGFISAQLHRGTAGSTMFINVAVWESAEALGAPFRVKVSMRITFWLRRWASRAGLLDLAGF